MIGDEWYGEPALQEPVLVHREVGNTDVAYHASADQVGKGRSCFFRIHQWVGMVQQQDVDVIGLQVGEGAFHTFKEVLS